MQFAEIAVTEATAGSGAAGAGGGEGTGGRLGAEADLPVLAAVVVSRVPPAAAARELGAVTPAAAELVDRLARPVGPAPAAQPGAAGFGGQTRAGETKSSRSNGCTCRASGDAGATGTGLLSIGIAAGVTRLRRRRRA